MATAINNGVMKWTDERDTELKEWVAAGKSRTWIAKHYCETLKVPCTRNMVVGRIYRLQLKPPMAQQSVNKLIVRKAELKDRKTIASRVLNQKREAMRRRGMNRIVRQELIDPKAPAPLNVPTNELEYYHCRAVIGDETNTSDRCARLHCGHHTEDGRYCEYHHARFYRRAQ